MISALQMYDWPEIRARTDAFYALVARALDARGVPAPARLSRPEEPAAAWRDGALVVGQTCGLPYVSGRCGGAVVVGRPDYGLEGAAGGRYASALVCRAERAGGLAAFRGAHAAINDWGSQSGCNALAAAVRAAGGGDWPFFSAVTVTGAHRASARMVAEGGADIAAIDAVAWALFAELDPDRHARLRVIGWTEPMPALPFITAAAHAADRDAISAALAEAARASPRAPGIPVAVAPATDADYAPIRRMAAENAGLRLAPDAPAL